MKIMGLSDFPYWLSWFVYYTLVVTIISILSAGFLMINVFQYSSFFVVFLFLWLYGFSLFSVAMFITQFISKPRTAGIISTLIHFLTYFAGAPALQPNAAKGLKVTMSFFPNIGMSLAGDVICALESL